MATVTGGPFRTPSGTPLEGSVVFQLVGTDGRALDEASDLDTSEIVVGKSTVEIDDTGSYSIELAPNEDLAPAGTRWARTSPAGTTRILHVTPAGGDEEAMYDDPPGAIESSALTIHRNDPAAHGVDQLDVDIAALAAVQTAHIAQRRIDEGGVHGVIEHRWERDGWTPFSRKIVNQDGAQALALSVAGDDGLVTGTVPGLGGQRELYIHEDTAGCDAGEITALIGRPSTYTVPPDASNRPQGGVVVAYQQIAGHHVALLVWWDVFLGVPSIHNINAWRGNGGTTLGQGTGGQLTVDTDRSLRVLQVERFSFIGWINGYVAHPYHLHDLRTGDLLDIDVSGDDTFDAGDQPAANVDRNLGIVQTAEPDSTSPVPLKVVVGTITPAQGHKRWFPYWLRARRVGHTISVMAWRTTEAPPPAWQATVTVAPSVDVPQLPDPAAGGFGLVAAHVHSGSSVRYGPVTFRRL